jgi:hypothetical protein
MGRSEHANLTDDQTLDDRLWVHDSKRVTSSVPVVSRSAIGPRGLRKGDGCCEVTLVENTGYGVTSDKIFSNLADWINALS